MTATTSAENLLVRRAQAIDRTGWGLRPHLVQPRNLAFWVYLAVVAVGTVTQIGSFSDAFGAYGSVIVFSVVVFAVYGALFWWFTHRIDRYAAQPVSLILTGFAWAAFAATWAMAAPANNAIRALYAKGFGQNWALNWSAGLTAPFTEEIAKGLGLVLLLTLAPRVVRTAFDGFILGAFIGLGFQLLEDVSYALNTAVGAFASDPLQASISTTAMRMATGISGHILYSSIFCAGLIYLLGTPAQRRRPARGIGLMLMAMALHGTWDSVSAIGAKLGGGPMVMVLLVGVIAVSILAVIAVFRLTVKPERAAMRDVMAPEVALGAITTAELDALSGGRKARKEYVKTAAHTGRRRHARHVLEASADLADTLAKSHGIENERVGYARSEVVRIRQVN